MLFTLIPAVAVTAAPALLELNLLRAVIACASLYLSSICVRFQILFNSYEMW